MARFSFRMTFYECELEMLEKAFTHYLGLCKRGIENDEVGHSISDSVMIKGLRSELRKKGRRPSRIMMGALEKSALDAVLASYLDVCEREIAKGATAPFTYEKVMIGLIREAMETESSRGTLDGALALERLGLKA
jgi:hypothetical protein